MQMSVYMRFGTLLCKGVKDLLLQNFVGRGKKV